MDANKQSVISKSILSVGGLILVLVILILVNVLFSKATLRWDITQDKLYSLSANTRSILADLEQPVTLKVFFSQSIPNVPVTIKSYAGRLIDFLSEYEQHSSGKLVLEIFDPKQDSDEEEWAHNFGIEGIDLPTGDRMYLGLVAAAADQQQAIPMMDPAGEERLEYDITRLIWRVQSAQKPKIGVVSSLPVFGGGPRGFGMPQQGMQPWVFINELRKTYDVQKIEPSSERIDENVNLLLLMHPKNLDDKLLYAIDQFILKGGNVVAFIDPVSVTDSTPGPSKASAADKLLTAWGLSLDTVKVVADYDMATRLRGRDNRVEDNPLWLSVGVDAFNTKNIITAQLEKMLLPVAGALKFKETEGIEYEVLIQSSLNSTLEDTFKARMGADEIRRNFKPSADQYDLAARLTGRFNSIYGDAPPPATAKDAESKDKPKHLKTGQTKATVIVVADTDFLYDGYYVNRQSFLGFQIAQVFNDNLNFLLNACEMLTGSRDLIGLRTRAKLERPFTRVEALRKRAQAQWLVEEQELVAKVEATNRKLSELERQKDPSQKMIVSQAQEEEIRRFQQEKRDVSKRLKEVRRNLNADIEALGNRIKFINIFLIPLCVLIAGALFGLTKMGRHR